MGRVFVGVGSNVAPDLHVPRALARRGEAVGIVAVSTVYVTPPLGRPADPPLVNGVVEVRDVLEPAPLRASLRRIERDEGRRRTSDRFAPRPIDLDLLLHGDSVSTSPPLPHPDVATRRFVAVPLLELDPELTLPGSGARLAALLEALPPWPMEPEVRLTRMLGGRFGNGRGPG